MPARSQNSRRARVGLFEDTALFEFSKVINSSLELRFVLNHTLLTIMGKILASRGMVVLAHDNGRFRVALVKGFSPSLEGHQFDVERVPPDLFVVRGVNARRYPWITFFRDAGVHMLLPLFSDERHVGFLAFGERLSRRPLQQREITYLRSLANLAGASIERNHMIVELQQLNRKLDRKLQELNTLVELGKEFSAVLDPEKLVRLLVLSLLGHTGTGRYLVCARDGADVRILSQRVDGSLPQGELLAGLFHVKSPSTIAEMIVRGGHDPRSMLSSLGLSVVVPMTHQGQTRGLIFLGDKVNREPFSEADLELVTSIGNLAIIALENARLFEEAIEKQRMEDDLLLAREIQKGLLPSVLPHVRDIQIAATNVSSKQVGGDYYDCLALADERYIIAIGDVSGKGSPASLLMANLQATIRALVPLHLPLGELTGRVNDLMCQNTGGNKFVTFFWGALDAVTRTLTYVNAGHNYPLLLRADDSVERLDRGGMILGVMHEPFPYEEDTIELRPADVLVLFTDGVSEAMSKDSVEYGEDRLLEVVRQASGGDARAILEAIQEDVTRHTHGAPQSDDITMMVLKVVPPH